MKAKTSVSLLIAVALGIVTTKVGRDMIASRGGGSGDLGKVVIAKRDLEPGYVLQVADLALSDMPAKSLPKTVFREIKPLVGRTVVSQVVSGQMLFDTLVASEGSPSGILALVPDGMRAVTIEVSESSGVSALLAPGCHVDVIATLRKGHQTIARTIVQNVKVSAVSRKSSKDSTSAVKAATLVVTPRQAEAIELAAANGRPRLILRGGADGGTEETAGVTLAQLLGEETVDVFADESGETINYDAGGRRPVQVFKGGTESVMYLEAGATPQDSDGGVEEIPAGE